MDSVGVNRESRRKPRLSRSASVQERRPRRPWARATVALGMASLLAACASGPVLDPIDPRGVGVSAPIDEEVSRERRRRGVDLTPPHAADRADQLVRVALLLPFSSSRNAARAEADAMFKAAQLSLFERGHDNILLIPKDTAGTAAGARAAARSAVDDGADVLLGPLFSLGVEAAAAAIDVEDTPIIAFSNDRTAAGSGAFLMGLAPEDEVQRLVEYALRQGLRRFSALAPDNRYGQRVRDALNVTAIQYGGELSDYALYPPNASAEALTRPARTLAKYDARLAYNEARSEEPEEPLPAPTPTPQVFVAADGTVQTRYVTPRVGFDVGYDAILLPTGGVQLLTLAPLMPYYDVDPRQVRFMGTSQWRDERVLEEPALQRGWFVDTDPGQRRAFEVSYGRTYGEEPSRLSSLAYDAMTLVSFLTDPRRTDTRSGGRHSGLSRASITRESGFFGVDGIFRFGEDGLVQRGLAILQIRNGEFRVLEPAPRSFDEILARPRPLVSDPRFINPNAGLPGQQNQPPTNARPPTGATRTGPDGIPRPTY